MDVQTVGELTRRTLLKFKLEDPESAAQNGKDFYTFLFTAAPDLRNFFKGAQTYTSDQIQGSERFAKQGFRLLLSQSVLSKIISDEALFTSYIRELILRHKMFKIPNDIWPAFYPLYIAFLESKMSLTADEKKAWTILGEKFVAETVKVLNSDYY
uniref:GLOBIN domain-containing protein n=1 Tax=Rhabditophanes sp. KR3021 TaxID=114890 RepID=A0AC35UDR0_9BILA